MAHRRSNLERNRWTVELLNVQSDDVICELGPGPGVTLGLLIAKARSVIAIDHSPLMIRQCAARHREALNQGRLVLREASFTDLPDIGQVDKMIAVNSLQFDAMSKPALRAIRAHLRPGGRLAVTFQPRGKAPTEDDVDRAAAKTRMMLEAAGFEDLQEHRLPLDPVSAVCLIGRRPE
jgi:SAM-dependent methyltransferase